MAAPLHLAPHQACPGCGWTGHDWSFRYQRYCKKCYAKWKKEQRAELRRLRPKNENVSVEPDLVVTSRVEKKLMGNAQKETPFSRLHQRAEAVPGLVVVTFWGGVIGYNLLDLDLGVDGVTLFWIWLAALMGLFFLADSVGGRESSKRFQLVLARRAELARQRKRQIEEKEAFYASPEWKLLRDEVIKEQGRICRLCRTAIDSDADVTVDHVRPRSKHPELALSKGNLQVLCRPCNSSKGDREAE